MWTRPSTGWPGCWRQARTRGSSCAGSSSWPRKTSAWPTPGPWSRSAAASRALDWVGLPEGQYHLAQATLYLALAPKSNSTQAYFRAKAALEDQGATRVPAPLQDAHRDKKGLGHGQGYLYPHDFPGHWVDQAYLPADLAGVSFYAPGTEGEEPELAARWQALTSRGKEIRFSREPVGRG